MMSMMINNTRLNFSEVVSLKDNATKLELSSDSKDAILKCRQYLDQRLDSSEETIYGINTGFGSLCNTSIPKEELTLLQHNLVRSHACGMGKKVNPEVVRLMMGLKIFAISKGYSGVQLATVERLIYFYNNNIIPVVYDQGSLGASGDLAPLAHLSLPIIGEGEVYYQGVVRSTAEVLSELSISPVQLKAKEGLALLNGTQFMQALGLNAILNTKQLLQLADLNASFAIEAYNGRTSPFNELLHLIRPHEGQLTTALNIRNLLKGSDLDNRPNKDVQDPYSFRCTPQVHGASKIAWNHVKEVFMTEVNSVTDNPTIFVDEQEVLSGGNFHGQMLATSLDYLKIAMAELGSISERRIYRMIEGNRGLPAFLTHNPGLESGFMILQYSAASIVSKNKQLATPSSIDSIDSSKGQEDHVSMGANAAVLANDICENVQNVLGMELLTNLQALSFRKNIKISATLQRIFEQFVAEVGLVENDQFMHPKMKKAISFALNLNLDKENILV